VTFEEYQKAAARTINAQLTWHDVRQHALSGMVSELGEVHGIYQKGYQGHPISAEHIKKEIGDLLWFISEFCTSQRWSLDEVAQMNIDKLLERYPAEEGFTANRSLHRKDGDI